MIVVVTGASRGIGRAIAQDLAKGTTLVISARDRAGLAETAAMIERAGGRAVPAPGDICKDADREDLVRIAEQEGPIDVLVNNAGIEIAIPLLDQTAEEIQRQLDVNLLAPVLLTRRVLPNMITRKRGIVVMISSMAGKSPTPYDSVYSATKHGLNGFASSLRFELEGTGVHVGVVCPSFVAGSGMWADGGLRAPTFMREVPMKKVLKGVRRVIAGKQEVLVTPGPVRPLLAIGELFPSSTASILKALGVVDVLKKRKRGE